MAQTRNLTLQWSAVTRVQLRWNSRARVKERKMKMKTQMKVMFTRLCASVFSHHHPPHPFCAVTFHKCVSNTIEELMHVCTFAPRESIFGIARFCDRWSKDQCVQNIQRKRRWTLSSTKGSGLEPMARNSYEG